MLSRIRWKLRPQDFERKESGATVNYYFVRDMNLDPNTLYMFYKMLVGDAAGLVDLYRGVRMDNAALSGRLAIKAITKAEEEGLEVTKVYENLMKKVVKKGRGECKKQMKRFSSNDELEKSLSSLNMLKGGLLMLVANKINKILPPEKLIFLPL